MLLTGIAKDEEGQTLVEYGLIVGLVSVALVATRLAITGSLTTVFTAITTALNQA